MSGDDYNAVVKHTQHGDKYSFCIVVLGPLALSWVLVSGDAYGAEVKRTRGFMNTCAHFVAEGRKLIGNDRFFIGRDKCFDIELTVHIIMKLRFC